MQLRARQEGLGALGWLIVLAIGSFALTCLLKIGPVYLDYFQIRKALDDVAADAKTPSLTNSELRTVIGKRLEVNRIETIRTSDIKFVDTREGRMIDATYEQRVPLIANIDVVVKFDKLKYTLPSR
ncbi:MAG: DUF4845 domain-containing protein [Spongiibacteraceae bacterium]|jgi:hypothetical protein|nr:DUF4845 domain-containing protein [Spongiibacteraceae bacterium]